MTAPRYSHRPDDVTAARRFLIDARDRQEGTLPTYEEFVSIFGNVPQRAASVLNSIAAICANNGEPDLTVLVVRARVGLEERYEDGNGQTR